MPLVLPKHVAAQEINRLMEEQADADIAEARYWSKELKRIDTSLDIVWVGKCDEPELEPYCWHIRKRIPGSIDAYIPLMKDGVRCPPGGWLLDYLTANDLWNERVHRDKKEAAEKLRQAKVRRRKLEAEQRQDEIALAYRAARRLRGDAGLTTRTDKKRAGEGLKKKDDG